MLNGSIMDWNVPIFIKISPIIVAIIGIFLAWYFYIRKTNVPILLIKIDIKHELDIQKGSSTFFFKKYVYDILEQKRFLILSEYAVYIQSFYRSYKAQKQYHKIKYNTTTLI